MVDVRRRPDIRDATYWVRPWASNIVCVSDRALAACPLLLPTHFLPSGPRNCANTPGNRSGDAAYCIILAAEYAGFRALNVPHHIPILFGCLATSMFVYRCTAGGTSTTPLRTATVTFSRSKTTWTTMVGVS